MPCVRSIARRLWSRKATSSTNKTFSRKASRLSALGRPEEVVATMLTLCARDNSHLTGQAVAVDGGISALCSHANEEMFVGFAQPPKF